MGERLDTTLKCVLALHRANNVLGCIKRSMTSKLREVVLSLDSRVWWDSPGIPGTGRTLTFWTESRGEMLSWLEVWCTSPIRRIGIIPPGKGKALAWPNCVPQERYRGTVTRAWSDRIGGNGFKLRVGLDKILEKNLLGWWGTGTCCLEKPWMPLPW